MYIHSVQTTKGEAASQRDTNMDETELGVWGGGGAGGVEMHSSKSLFVCAHMIDCQLNLINRHWANKSILELLGVANSIYLQL